MVRRLLIFASIAAALAGTALAQGRHKRTAGAAGSSGHLIARIERRVNLTDAQKNQFQELVEKRRVEMQSLRQESKPERKALKQLLRQSNPNPNEVGNATIALRDNTLEQKRDINQRFIAGVKGILTPEQLRALPKRLR
jgi:Spy/CpxP family protein refolding chaperone